MELFKDDLRPNALIRSTCNSAAICEFSEFAVSYIYVVVVIKCQPQHHSYLFMETGPQAGKHLYSRGWLGLIPLIGGFVGLWLIVLGILKYKNRKLIIIGTAALLFTVIVYSSMAYYFEYSRSFRKDFSVFCQPQLNELIKSIEFYKIENGHYPDSLDELRRSSDQVRIDDPIAQTGSDNKSQFYYKHIHGKYILFSSGIDRIPYNNDDIFPSSNLFDSTKTGLIKP
jgi:hypothetical protein